MTEAQEEVFWTTIKAFNELGILSNIMIIGSWGMLMMKLTEYLGFIKRICLSLNF